MSARTRCDAMDEMQVEALLSGAPFVPPTVQEGAAPPPEAERVCRMCLDSAVAPGDRLFSPCQCRGTIQYVHASCLDEWRAKSPRKDSAHVCEQCGTAYRLRMTPWMRLLDSRVVRAVLCLGVFLLLAQVLGVLLRLCLQYTEPALFNAVHPWTVQSVAHAPSSPSLPWMLLPEHQSDGLSLLWDDRVEEEPDPLPSDATYQLGYFQPWVLLHIVQGLLQRSLETLVRLPAAPPVVQQDLHFPRAVLRIVTVQALWAGAADTPGTEPVSWCLARSYEFTLGLALMGMTSHFHTLVLSSSLGFFHYGTPFVVVAMYALPGSATHVAAVWESVHYAGLGILALVVWGLVRTYVMIYQQLEYVAQYLVAHTPRIVAEYDADLPPAPAPAAPASPRRSWAHWAVQRVVRGHEAMRDLDDPRFLWMLAQAGD
ncbi:hypothetical protein MNAN1_003957 [Malassezia nana]|uniref:RING-CH-type domain-containing protein n=1 Tax=Malassezia nana TaxID=180528 RepID=A0AAF0J468_9BASI|nr:hypothetical protein MNAN1_003957 [Malassezia nana]